MSRMKMLSLFACVALIHAHPSDNAGQNSKVANPSAASSEGLRLDIIPPNPSSYRVKKGDSLHVNCNFNNLGQVWWMKGDRDVTDRTDQYQSSNAKLVITSTKIEDSGSYTCLAKTEDGRSTNKIINVEVYDPPAVPGPKSQIVEVNSSTSLSCPIEEHDIDSSNLEWKRLSAPDQLLGGRDYTSRNGIHSTMILEFPKVSYENDGTYQCSVKNKTGAYIRQDQRFLIVTGLPEIKLSVKGIGAHRVYLNWTIIEHNIPVARLTIESRNMKQGNEQDEEWTTYPREINIKHSSLIWENLDRDVLYRFRMNAYNLLNESLQLIYSDPDSTKTLKKDYEYTPSFTVTKKTNESITFEFEKVPKEFNGYFDYFNVSVTNHGVNATEPKYFDSNGTTLTYELSEPQTAYKVRAAACSSYTEQCGEWSSEKVISNSSAGLHPSRMNLVAVIIASVYFSMKHFIA